VDSRSSDAVAIAVRFRAPIRCYEAVLEATGITPEEEAEINRDETELEEQDLDEHDVEDDEALSLNLETTEVDEDQSSKNEDDVESAVKFDEDFKKRNILELKKNLNDAIRNEDYESASKIRDKIDKINSDN
jgi:excinuclease UvrABC helicase subunit UvrB